MRLFIAEKPSLARAIAEGIGNGRKGEGCIHCGDDIVTWCFGHLLEQCYPEDYKPEYASWQRVHLPIIPSKWKLKPKKQAKTQLSLIREMLKKADSVVNAGDPDREGQLLIDEVLEHFAYRGSVSRIWLASLDSISVKKALGALSDNTKYAPLRDSARARSQADWLIGINATRAMTITGRETGRSEVLSLGRVQTPTLALVVSRDKEIASFRPIDYFILRASLGHPAGDFIASFVPSDSQAGLDSNGRLVDAVVVNHLSVQLNGIKGIVVGVTKEKKIKNAPFPHSLSSLQKDASARIGLTAQECLDTAQSLYEKKLTTYPRSDCRYLPDEQFDAAKQILSTLASIAGLEQTAGNADFKLKSSAWNTQKITAHHAIIPTGETPDKLTDKEHNLYMMIAQAYCLQFFPAMQYEAQKITVTLQDTRWEATGRLILESGWTMVAAAEEETGEDEKKQALPSVGQGDKVQCQKVEFQKKKTSPPSRFTEGTLIEAMANIHRFVSDPAAKSVLKENEGIGTEATRAGVLETLKNRKYLISEKKALVATQLGRDLIELTPIILKDPVTTASWESKLEAIAQGKGTLAAFMGEQERILPELMTAILGTDSKPAFACSACGKAMSRMKGKKSNGWFWGCSGYPSCKHTAQDVDGKPSETPKQSVLTAYTCTACKKKLVKRSSAKGEFYGCSGYPACKQTYQLSEFEKKTTE